jgi:hypothetical protein
MGYQIQKFLIVFENFINKLNGQGLSLQVSHEDIEVLP